MNLYRFLLLVFLIFYFKAQSFQKFPFFFFFFEILFLQTFKQKKVFELILIVIF